MELVLRNYFLFVDVMEVHHQGERCANSTGKYFIVRPVSAVRPSSVTTKVNINYYKIEYLKG